MFAQAAAAGSHRAGASPAALARGSAAAAPPPPPETFDEVKGLPLLKDFVDPDTRLLRPYLGHVTRHWEEEDW